jgi:beta-1,2-mannobiose phosphorylase / 1,2-beta-oligomannan phosphorylase
VHYVAGALVLDADDPHLVRYRSPTPILEPETEGERSGVVPNVVFPTGIDDRGNGRVDVYYGMADQRIGVARLQVPATLP